MTLRLGAIGTFVFDRIHHPTRRGRPREQWGGLIYSLCGLSAAAAPGWEVLPIVKVGGDLEESARRMLRSLPSVRDRFARTVPEPNNRVELRYTDAAERTERLTGGVPAWTPEEILPLVGDLDALYLNFVSGTELSLATLTRLRRRFDGPIYADLHSLFLGPPSDESPRRPRRLANAREWLRPLDAVQLNATELSLMDGTVADLPDLLERGPSIAVVTSGAEGAEAAVREGLPADPLAWRGSAAGSGTRRIRQRPPGGPADGDPTGCGDVWGAVFFARLLAGDAFERAFARAGAAAAVKVGIPQIGRLREAVAASCQRPPVLP